MTRDPERMRARLEKQRVRSKKRYDDLRARGLCTRNPAHGPTGGGVHCAPCKVDSSDYRKEVYALKQSEADR